MKHPNLIEWEKTLKKVIDNLDDVLEDQFGNQYQLHPARPKRGRTANKSHDGLFDITAQFSLGIGSQKGKGYIVDIRLSTLENVPDEIYDKIENVAIRRLRQYLKNHFPEKQLSVEKDGRVIKLFGDLSLGKV